MSATLIGIVTLIYVGVTISEFAANRPGMAIAFLGYALANIGLIWQTMK